MNVSRSMKMLMNVALGILGISIGIGQGVMAQTRLGLHVTQEELNIWKQRAASGPYKTKGDMSNNSPGDWDRIVVNRNAFASDPTYQRWTTGPQVLDANGCVPKDSSATGDKNLPPGYKTGMEWSTRLRDAAFYNLVMGVTTDRAAIKREILWLVDQPWARFGNPNGIWCFGVMWDVSPSFALAAYLTKILFAYDYVGRSTFTQAELDKIDRWFFDAADFWRRDADTSLNSAFVDRWAGDYTVKNKNCEANTGDLQKGYAGGPDVCYLARWYNNRRGGILQFSALTGLYLQSHGRNYTNGRYGTLGQLVESGRMYVREYVRYALFPEGMHGDFHRSATNTTAKAESGWAYGSVAAAQVLTIADAHARAGDPSLYEYNTAEGFLTTAGTIRDGGNRVGQNKDLLFGLQSFMKYHTDIYARYFPTVGVADDRIDGRTPRNGSTWNGVNDVGLIMANVYFRDAFVKQAYTRTHPGTIPYPPSPADAPRIWMGHVGIFPGMLFMFGQMEGKVWPYMANEPTPPPSPPPSFSSLIGHWKLDETQGTKRVFKNVSDEPGDAP